MKTFAALVLVSASAWAQPAIAPPQLGFVEDRSRALRPAYGLAGNFILGSAVAVNIVSEAFSGSLGLLKTDLSLAAFNSQGKLLASIDATAGPALFAFSPNGASALAYVPSSNSLFEWRGSGFLHVWPRPEEVIADDVLAIAFPTTLEASLIVQRNDTLWELNVPIGKIGMFSQRALVGLHAPVLVLPAGDIVYRDADGIMIRRTDGSEVHIAASLPANFSLQQMKQDWVQLTDLNSPARFAIRVAPGRESLYQLPE